MRTYRWTGGTRDEDNITSRNFADMSKKFNTRLVKPKLNIAIVLLQDEQGVSSQFGFFIYCINPDSVIFHLLI
jgi:endo-1,4-beta-mannosidase